MTELLQIINEIGQNQKGLFNVLTSLCALIMLVLVIIPLKTTKELSVSIKEKTNILSVNIKDEKFVVLYDGKTIKNPTFVSINFTNTGDETIKNDDFTEPFSIVFDSGAEVLSANLNSENSLIAKDLAKNAELNKNSIAFKKFMLNKNESFVVNIILSKPSDSVKYSYRILGCVDIGSHLCRISRFLGEQNV